MNSQPLPTLKGRLTTESAGEVRLRHGKYANIPFKRVPSDYLLWVADNYREQNIKRAAQMVLDGRTIRAALQKSGGAL